MNKIVSNGRRTGRTTRMAQAIAEELMTSDRPVIVVVHEIAFKSYINGLITHMLREHGMPDELIRQTILQRLRYDATGEQRGLKIFTDHHVLEHARGG